MIETFSWSPALDSSRTTKSEPRTGGFRKSANRIRGACARTMREPHTLPPYRLPGVGVAGVEISLVGSRGVPVRKTSVLHINITRGGKKSGNVSGRKSKLVWGSQNVRRDVLVVTRYCVSGSKVVGRDVRVPRRVLLIRLIRIRLKRPVENNLRHTAVGHTLGLRVTGEESQPTAKNQWARPAKCPLRGSHGRTQTCELNARLIGKKPVSGRLLR